MTQEHKELLLKDLCSRIPYKVKCQIPDKYGGYTSVIENIDIIGYVVDSEGNLTEIELVRPYLFPLSSMTEEQRKELFYLSGIDIIDGKFYTNSEFTLEETLSGINWLLKNHFDINGLIPIGLANNAAGLNIY